jgi:hypothetical protein
LVLRNPKKIVEVEISRYSEIVSDLISHSLDKYYDITQAEANPHILTVIGSYIP